MISLLCPTRGRPDGLARMAASFAENTVNGYELLCWLDADDPALPDYDTSLMAYAHISQAGRVGSSAMWNELAKVAHGDHLMMVNDDSLMRTPGWDHILTQETPADGYFVAWPHAQGMQCINPIVSRQWYDTLGYFIPPGYQWWWCDTALRHIGAEVGRLIFLPSIHCEHMYHQWGKSEMDATYERNNNDAEHERDKQHFLETQAWLANEAKKIALQIFRAAGYQLRPVGQ